MLEMNGQFDERLPLYEKVAGKISFLIEKGTLRPGDKVPSIRNLSKQMQVSINTVKEAYSLLEDRRLLEARPQSGYYVRARLPELSAEPVVDRPDINPAEVSLSKVYQEVMMDFHDQNLLQLGIAVPNIDLLPVEKLHRMLAREIRRFPIQAVSYDLPPGNLRLRKQVAQRLLLSGCTLSPDQIVITSGCVEAVVLSLRTLCKPGDAVAIETPVYFNFLQMIEDLGLKALEIPASPRGGISLEALEYALERNAEEVKACIVLSNFNNPLGSKMSDEDKVRLVQLLDGYQVPLIEDDIYGDLAFGLQRPRTLYSYAQEMAAADQVILCSSFSKSLSRDLRIGWIVPGRFTARITKLKLVTQLASSRTTQTALQMFFEEGSFDRYLRQKRQQLSDQCRQLQQLIREFFPQALSCSQPKGGLALWLELPETIDTVALYNRARKEGISLTPGRLFTSQQRYNNCLRLSFAQPWNEDRVAALKRVAELVNNSS